MRKGWQTRALREVLQRTETVDPSMTPEEEFDYIDISSVSNKTLRIETTQRLNGKSAPSRARKLVKSNDVLFATIRPTLSRIAVVPKTLNEQVCSTGYLVLRPTDVVEHRYLFYWLQSEAFMGRMESLQKGASYPAVTDAQVRDQLLSFPAKPEQRRIIGILDEAFEGIATAKANAEKNIQSSRAVFNSHLQSIFGRHDSAWVRDRLENLTTKIGSGATPRGGERAYKTQGVSLIRSLNVYDDGFRYAKLARIDEVQAARLSIVEVQPRDVLLNITGASVARCCVVPADVLPARVNQHVSIIRPIFKKLEPEFLHYALISSTYKDQLLQTGAEGGATRQAITKSQIQAFEVWRPGALEDQRAVVAELDALKTKAEGLGAIYQKKLAALEGLKQSLLHQAFIGTL